MADNRYQPNVYRRAGGVAFVVADEGFLEFEAGGYVKRSVTNHTTQLSVLVPDGINWVSSATTGLSLLLPSPAVSGQEVWFLSRDATTGAFPITASTAGLNILIGSSTEVGTFVDNNTAIQTSGTIVGFKAHSSSGWLVISNVGGGICSTYTTVLASTV